MLSGDIALQIHHGKRGQENTTRIPQIWQQGKVVWDMQRSTQCPKISCFLNALSFWRAGYEKRKAGDLLQSFLFPTC